MLKTLERKKVIKVKTRGLQTTDKGTFFKRGILLKQKVQDPGEASRLPCYVSFLCMLTYTNTNKNPNANKLSWVINYKVRQATTSLVPRFSRVGRGT